MKVNFKFDDDDFSKKMNEYAKKKPSQVKQEVARTSEQIVSQAKSLVNVDTGNLKNSINVSYYKGGFTGHIGTPVEYAADQEFTNRGNPYLFPSHEQEMPKFISNMKALLKEV